MAGMQRLASSVNTSASSYASCRVSGADTLLSDQFPSGLRVLVVDDDTTCLRILEQMLRRCLYLVTSCSQAKVALDILRERKGYFDVVLSDVHMPDMDGFKLLEHVGLEMDLPVIMMSADGRTSAVMKGIRHGACDYLIKPVREEELKNIWQHVIRKKFNENKEIEHSGSLEDNDRNKRGNDDIENASSAIEGTEGGLKGQKKRNNAREDDDGDMENDDPSTSKKPRVVWSVELHQQFVSAVNQLGIDKAVPKRILELMNVPGLTRENVASHLQKFRLYLKRLSGVAHQSGISNPLCGSMEPNMKINQLGRFDIQALAASGQIPPQTLAALHDELFGRPTGSLMATIGQPSLLQVSLQGPKCMPVEHGVAFGQPLIKCQSSYSKHCPQNMASVEDVASGFSAWPSSSLGTIIASGNNLGGMKTQNGNMLMDAMQHQKQQQHAQLQSSLAEASRSINVQPSCLVVPTQSTSSYPAGNSSNSINQSCGYNRGTIIDYSLLSPQSNFVHVPDGDVKATGVASGYTIPGSISSVSSSCLNADTSTTRHVQNSTMLIRTARQSPMLPHSSCDIQGSYGTKPSELVDQASFRNLGGVGKLTGMPSRFAANEFESPMGHLGHGKVYVESNGNKVKQEPSVELMDNARVGIPVLQQFPPSDLMSVLTE